MGLKKRVVLPNGIALNYHRIVGLRIITNHVNTIEVCSYTSYSKREEQKTVFENAVKTGQWEEFDAYTNTSYVEAPYDQTMTIQSAYEYLKQHEGFEDATDILEEGQPQTQEEMASASQTELAEQQQADIQQPTDEEGDVE